MNNPSSLNATASRAELASGDLACYHCGLPVPSESDWQVEVMGQVRAMCCVGCEAVAAAIVSNGLDEYYRHRDAMPESQRTLGGVPDELRDLSLYDHAEVQRDFVRALGEHEREAALILEGLTCAACVWLNEQHIARQPGVLAVEINYSTRRARVRWDDSRIHLSAILAAVQAIGYRAWPYDASRSEDLARKEKRTALWRLFVAGFGMMQVMMYAVPMYLAADGEVTPEVERLMRWASMVLTLPVMLYSAKPFFVSAIRDLDLRRLGMDVPVALGIGAAFLASVWGTLQGSGEVYFDSVTMFVFFLLGGRYLELIARQRAVRGVEQLNKAIPQFASRLDAWPAREITAVPVNQLQPGDVVQVAPGAVVPADGCVLEGVSHVDESLLTGESRPIGKTVGDDVTGGSLNIESPLYMSVTHVGQDTRLAAIHRLMERAAHERPQLVKLADKVASRFVLALLLLAALTAIIWWQIDPSRMVWVFAAVLVVSCPCALSLATPAALMVSTGAMARLGLLVTRGHAIETFARVDHVVFDKTGTLTEGKMVLAHSDVPAGLDQADMLQLAASLEQGSEHPVGQALRSAAASNKAFELEGLHAVTGQGIEAHYQGRTLRIGKASFVQALGCDVSTMPTQHDAAATRVVMGDSERWLAVFELSDTLREGAVELVRALRQQGVKVTLLSGDDAQTVRQVADALGIEDAQGNLLPQDKRERLLEYQAAGRVVAMVGDGVNDAPVLAQAQVSIAMGSGTELARTQGDMVLLSGSLKSLQQGLVQARKTLRIIRLNLMWSFVYNFGAIPLAMAGWITPWMAGIGMSSSSLLVVLNALRLQVPGRTLRNNDRVVESR